MDFAQSHSQITHATIAVKMHLLVCLKLQTTPNVALAIRLPSTVSRPSTSHTVTPLYLAFGQFATSLLCHAVDLNLNKTSFFVHKEQIVTKIVQFVFPSKLLDLATYKASAETQQILLQTITLVFQELAKLPLDTLHPEILAQMTSIAPVSL